MRTIKNTTTKKHPDLGVFLFYNFFHITAQGQTVQKNEQSALFDFEMLVVCWYSNNRCTLNSNKWEYLPLSIDFCNCPYFILVRYVVWRALI